MRDAYCAQYRRRRVNLSWSLAHCVQFPCGQAGVGVAFPSHRRTAEDRRQPGHTRHCIAGGRCGFFRADIPAEIADGPGMMPAH